VADTTDLTDTMLATPASPDDVATTPGRRFGWAAFAVIALSAVLHLIDLGSRPLAHDEAIDAWFSWQARGLRVAEYDPVYHGPLRFYLEGFVLDTFGTSPGWARLVAALAGIAMTVVIAGSSGLLGRVGAPLAALLFTISPTALTVTRTGREDSLTALVSLGLLLVIANGLVAPRARHVVAGGALLATSLALKETTFIFGFAGACFFAGLAIWAVVDRSGPAARFWSALRELGAAPWMWSTVAFLAIVTVVFTSGFRYQDGFLSGLIDGIDYWWSQHPVERGSQKWHFYGTVYLAYEWLVLAFAAAGLAVTIRRRSIVGMWFASMALVQFVVYTWAGEKFAWLAIHPLVPTVLLAGLGGQAAWDRFRRSSSEGARQPRIVSAAVVAGLSIAALGTLVIAIRPAITDGANTSELLVTVQTTEEMHALHARLIDARERGDLGPILVDQRDSGSWPWAWYLHDVADVAWSTVDPTQPLPAGYDAYIVSASTDPPPIPDGYRIERFPLRGWWLPDYSAADLGDVARWLVTRETWSPRGTSDQFLIVRTGALD
jgi:uncharacterized protein (TIGR03663 family)